MCVCGGGGGGRVYNRREVVRFDYRSQFGDPSRGINLQIETVLGTIERLAKTKPPMASEEHRIWNALFLHDCRNIIPPITPMRHVE